MASDTYPDRFAIVSYLFQISQMGSLELGSESESTNTPLSQDGESDEGIRQRHQDRIAPLAKEDGDGVCELRDVAVGLVYGNCASATWILHELLRRLASSWSCRRRR